MIAHTILTFEKQTHCKRGHEYNTENIFIGPDGNRRCRICRNERARNFRKENQSDYNKYKRNWRKKNYDKQILSERKSDKKRYTQKLEYARSWYPDYLKQLRIEVLGHYGVKGKPVCVCCNETIWQFLTLDHVNGGGTKIRKENPRQKAWMLYQYLRTIFRKTGKWMDGYQTLCINCNLGRSRNNGICPHKEIKQ